MAKDVGDAIGAAIGHAAREVADTVSANARKGAKKGQLPKLSGGRGVAAGAGLAALVPLAAKGAGKMMHSMRNGGGPLHAAGQKVGGTVQDAVGKKVDEAGGASGLAKEAGKAMLPFGGGSDDDKQSGGGVGHGRRMPIQQAVDVAVPIKDAYEQWTQYEEWPKFMHRLDRVSQEDDEHVAFKAKFWGISREFKAEILDARPQERVKWRVTEGVSHTGVVTFHELGPRLTRVDVDIDVHPGSMIEKLGRGLRHAKRAVRADLHRFKAHVEIEEETGEGAEAEESKPKRSRSRSSSSSSSSRSGGSTGRRRAAASSSSSSSRSSGSSSRSGSGRSGSGSSRSTGGSNGASASGGSSRSSRSSSSNGSRSSSSRSSSSGGSGSRRRTASSSKS